jgi:hypothetical protein
MNRRRAVTGSADRFGVNSVAIAVPKGHTGRLAYIAEFIEEAKTSGLVQRAIENAGLRGVQVAAAGSRWTDCWKRDPRLQRRRCCASLPDLLEIPQISVKHDCPHQAILLRPIGSPQWAPSASVKEDCTAAERHEGITMTARIRPRAAKKLANVLAHCNRPDRESRPQRIFGVAGRPSLVL